ncbi:glycolate oxidase subunit GlcE [Amorphus coralli]|uniref:glycolate oxidase subunit GlcE n=1 Tax=Amorphus coralli TaxID=340680 RepID=UPI00058B26AE|nr:glycolate oxidase subunit GlcE [Amorphus coralli]
MSDRLTPTTADEVRDCVAWAVSANQPLEVVGLGSKRGIGRPVQASRMLDLSGVSGIVAYEPEELVLTVRAGTSLAEVSDALSQAGQEFAFEPMDHSVLLGSEGGAGTVGGLLAANLAGPRRIKAGAARDHVLGIAAVSGRGEIFKAGGRVVKNVTGYDLARGLAGSWGTLAVSTEMTFKVLPAGETTTTVVVHGLDDETAVRAMAAALGSSADVSGAAHLPAETAGSAGPVAGPATLLRLEGFAPSVLARTQALTTLLEVFGEIDTLDADRSAALWRDIRDCRPFAGSTSDPVWRVSVAPTSGPPVLRDMIGRRPARGFYDWGGGLVWIATGPEDDAGAAELRRSIAAHGGGHATLVRGSDALRTSVPVFEPEPGPLAALSARLKAQFDPTGILNPGRMRAGL